MTIDSVVASAIGTGSVGLPKSAAWQAQYHAGFVEELTKKNHWTESMSREERLLNAAILASRIHRQTKEIEWCVLLAKYSQCDKERAEAIKKLARHLQQTTLKTLSITFLLLAVSSWASVAIKRGLTEKIMQVDSELSRSTLYRKRNAVRVELQRMMDSVMTKLDITL